MTEVIVAVLLLAPIALFFAYDLVRTRRLQRECDTRNARALDENGEWDPRHFTIWGY